ncbi:MAG: hypothetical protein FWH11_11515 [Micrococcales bacterium]|nr:hypothetical protein [Micrococcales bacterium]
MRFQARAAELGRWLRTFDKPPSTSGADAHERQLARWRTSQLGRLRRGELAREDEAHLDAVAPGWWAPTRKERFRAQAAELGRWLRTYGKPPSASGADAHERQLARWRTSQLERLHRGVMAREYEAHLDAVAPGWWAPTRKERFRTRAAELGQWLRTSDGRPPYDQSDDVHERQLAGWRKHRLHQLRHGKLAREDEAHLDAVAPGWRARTSEERFEERFWAVQAAELGRWLRTFDKPPSANSDDARERRLASWRMRQLGRLRRGELAREDEAHLDAVAPGWRALIREERFRARAAELGQWLRASDGRLPRPYSDDKHERQLASWRLAQMQRLRLGSLPHHREQHLDAVAPGWRPRS